MKPEVGKFLKAMGFGKDESLWISQYDTWPVRGGFLNEYSPVGRFDATSYYCGKHRLFYVCDAVEDHHGDFSGMDVWHNSVMSCHRPCCRLCWKYGWCVREAKNIEDRFLTAQDKLGLPYSSVEHVCSSVPKNLYSLPYKELCENAILALRRSSVIGGASIFHAFRKDYVKRELFYSPHFHCLAYLQESYDRCRNCFNVGRCWECSGFEGVTRRASQVYLSIAFL